MLAGNAKLPKSPIITALNLKRCESFADSTSSSHLYTVPTRSQDLQLIARDVFQRLAADAKTAACTIVALLHCDTKAWVKVLLIPFLHATISFMTIVCIYFCFVSAVLHVMPYGWRRFRFIATLTSAASFRATMYLDLSIAKIHLSSRPRNSHFTSLLLD